MTEAEMREIIARVVKEELGEDCLPGYFPMPVSEALFRAGYRTAMEAVEKLGCADPSGQCRLFYSPNPEIE